MSDAQDFWKTVKFDLFKDYFFPLGCIGAVMVLGGMGVLVSGTTWGIVLTITGGLLFLPFAVHGNLLAVWHWKKRYRGKHTYLWGALFIFETSGWFKLVYLFRHIFPDYKNAGRYAETLGAPA